MGLSVRLDTPLPQFRLRVDLEIGPGVLALVGPSGAGKSSVLEMIAGLRRPESGVVVSDGRSWLDTARGIARPPEARRVGYVFQDLALFPHLSALENVAWGISGPRRARREEARALLERFDAAALAGRRARDLSGGERRRVALARAIGRRPEILLLDEPLAGLDADGRRGAIEQLRVAIEQTPGPTVLVTHDYPDAADLADEVAVIQDGTVVQRGTPRDIGAAPASRFVAALVGANTLHGAACARADGLTSVRLEGGALLISADRAAGDVVATIFPADVILGDDGAGSSMNRVSATVESVAVAGPRARVVLSLPERMVAEVTTVSAERLGLAPGVRTTAAWKATAMRLVAA